MSHRGIEANPDKIKAIEQIQAPKTVKDVRHLTGSVAVLSRFISKSAERALLFFKILKNNKARSTVLEMNLLSAATHLVKYLTSLIVLGA